METRAAVALEAGKPLWIETVDLEGPREGEVLVEINNGFDLMHKGESIRSVVNF